MSNKVLSSSSYLIAVVGLLLLSQAGCLWFNFCSARTHARAHAVHKSAHHSSAHAGRASGHSAPAARRRHGAAKSKKNHGHARGKSHGKSRIRGKSHGKSHSRVHHHVSQSYAPVKFVAPPDAGAPIDYAIAPRARNYALLTRSYTLYDEGVNEKLKGNYGAATDKLSESLSLLDQARSNQHNGVPSTLEAMVFFELGDAAESDGDTTLARDSYARCLKAKPDFVEAYLHIVNLLATQGQLPLAASWLREGLKECPHDQRINELSTQLSTYVGAAGTDLVPPPKSLNGPPEPEKGESGE